MAIGIGITSRGQIPRSELGPAMGPITAAGPGAGGRVGMGFNRAAVVAPLTPAYRYQASVPTDEPTTLEPRNREQAAFDVGQAQAGIVGTAAVGFGRFDLRDLARVLGGVLQFGGQLIGNPAALAAGRGLQRVAGAPRAPTPAAAAPAPELRGGLAAVAREVEAAIGPDGYTLQASRGTADLGAGVGIVQTVRGERQFSFEPFAFADGTAAGGVEDSGGGGRGQVAF